MHEISVMTEVIETVMRAAEAKRALRVVRVNLQVGELTFLSPDQMLFAFDILKQGGRGVIEGAELEIETIRARGVCMSCGYSGETRVEEMEEYHFRLPTLQCPQCGERLDITEGRDLYVRDIVMEVPDDVEEGGEDAGPFRHASAQGGGSND